MTLSTHVLDVEQGLPVAGVPVRAERQDGDAWTLVGAASTDAKGRVGELVPPSQWAAGVWRLTVDTAAAHGEEAFYREVALVIEVRPGPQGPPAHHHLPLLLSRHGCTTYRGS